MFASSHTSWLNCLVRELISTYMRWVTNTWNVHWYFLELFYIFYWNVEWRMIYIIKIPRKCLALLCTWIETMVIINSQPWGIGNWCVFKRVCSVHCICMKDTYFSDSFWITYVYQLLSKITNHINKMVNILMAPLITKTKQNLHQKIQEKLVCSTAYLSVNMFVFQQQSFHWEVMERSYIISGDNKIITLGKKSLFTATHHRF